MCHAADVYCVTSLHTLVIVFSSTVDNGHYGTITLGGEQLTKRDRPYEAPNKADWSEDGPCTLVR